MKNKFIILLILSIVLGIIFSFGELIKFILPYLLGLMLLFNFIDVEFDLKSFFKIELLYYFLITLFIVPFILYFSTINLNINFRIGLFLIAITPTAIGASIIVRLIGGKFDFTIIVTIFSNFLSILSYPILLRIYFGNIPTKISFASIFVNLFLVILIPFLLSIIIKRVPELRRFLSKTGKKVNFLFMIVVYIAISSASRNFKSINPYEFVLILIITILIAIFYFAAGYFMGKDIETKKALMSSLGQKNTGLCIMVALSNFNPLSSIPAAVYIIVHHTINSFIIYKFRNEKTEKE